MSIESRLHERTIYPAPAGRSIAVIVCPWCGCTVEARTWSLAGSGKRCECGAIHHWHPAVSDKETS